MSRQARQRSAMTDRMSGGFTIQGTGKKKRKLTPAQKAQAEKNRNRAAKAVATRNLTRAPHPIVGAAGPTLRQQRLNRT